MHGAQRKALKIHGAINWKTKTRNNRTVCGKIPLRFPPQPDESNLRMSANSANPEKSGQINFYEEKTSRVHLVNRSTRS
jgi:hypothetical protein